MVNSDPVEFFGADGFVSIHTEASQKFNDPALWKRGLELCCGK